MYLCSNTFLPKFLVGLSVLKNAFYLCPGDGGFQDCSPVFGNKPLKFHVVCPQTGLQLSTTCTTERVDN